MLQGLTLKASHKISPKVYKSLPLDQESPVHTLKPYLFKIHFNTILSSTLKFVTWSLPLRFSYQNCTCIYLLYALYVSFFSHPN